MATPTWYVKIDEVAYGPATMEQLRQWYSEGRITADSLVRNGKGMWVLASSLPNLIEPNAPASPLVATPTASDDQLDWDSIKRKPSGTSRPSFRVVSKPSKPPMNPATAITIGLLGIITMCALAITFCYVVLPMIVAAKITYEVAKADRAVREASVRLEQQIKAPSNLERNSPPSRWPIEDEMIGRQKSLPIGGMQLQDELVVDGDLESDNPPMNLPSAEGDETDQEFVLQFDGSPDRNGLPQESPDLIEEHRKLFGIQNGAPMANNAPADPSPPREIPADRKPNRILLKETLKDAASLFQQSGKKFAQAKTTAEQEKALEEGAQAVLEWSQSLRRDCIEFTASVRDVVRVEGREFAVLDPIQELLPYRNSPRQLRMQTVSVPIGKGISGITKGTKIKVRCELVPKMLSYMEYANPATAQKLVNPAVSTRVFDLIFLPSSITNGKASDDYGRNSPNSVNGTRWFCLCFVFEDIEIIHPQK